MRLAQAGLAVGSVCMMMLASGAYALVPAPANPLLAAVAALESGAYGEGLRALAAIQGLELPAEPRIATPAEALVALSRGELDDAGARAVLADVPPEMMPAVSTLLIGIAKADVLVQDANGNDRDAALAQLNAPAPSWIGLAKAVDGEAVVEDAPVLASVRDDVDTAPYILAEALLLEAVAAATPLLIAPDAPGDVVDQKPYILISNTGNDVYGPTDNAILIIDVGGNDVYNNAQGAPFASPGLAQVIVDLQGNDDYIRTGALPAGTVNVRGQGVGLAGVGGIVDLLGNDDYIASASYIFSPERVAADVVAQGAGILGAGFLIDAAGSDCVVATARSHGGAASVTAQGATTLGAGFIALLGTRAPGCLGAPYASAIADPRVLIDNPVQFQAELGPASVTAQGAAAGGAAALVGGTDSTLYTASADGGLASTTAQGAGALGAGALVDLGGSDTYRASSVATATLAINLEGFFAGVSAATSITLGLTSSTAQGAGSGGAGAHADVGTDGNSYDVSAFVLADAFSRAATTFSGGTTFADATVVVGRTVSLAHGAAETGVGLALAAAQPASLSTRDDVRSVRAEAHAHTTAIATGGAGNNAEASTTTGNADASGQGSTVTGASAQVDVGGDDSYLLYSVVDATADAIVAPAGAAVENLNAGSAKTDGHTKSTTGAALLVDVDGHDTYAMPPNTTPAVEDSCYSNSPPSGNTNIGIGIDALTTATLPANCGPPPPN